MAKCSSTGDCNRDRYACRSADQLNRVTTDAAVPETDAGRPPLRAEVIDSNKSQKFCVVKED
jgi:hypothetical protein